MVGNRLYFVPKIAPFISIKPYNILLFSLAARAGQLKTSGSHSAALGLSYVNRVACGHLLSAPVVFAARRDQ